MYDLGLSFSWLKNDDDYQQLIRLRHLAYTSGGKVPTDVSPQMFVDDLDIDATLILARQNQTIVGSVRVNPKVNWNLLRQVHSFDLECPSWLEGDFAEASRLCVHPDFQRQGLFWSLAAAMVRTCQRLGIQQLIGAATGKLLDRWIQCGFEDVGLNANFESLNHLKHHFIQMDVAKVVGGLGTGSRFRQVLKETVFEIPEFDKRSSRI